jgi:hypothetical protein
MRVQSRASSQRMSKRFSGALYGLVMMMRAKALRSLLSALVYPRALCTVCLILRRLRTIVRSLSAST